MSGENLKSAFLPAQTASEAEVREQAKIFEAMPDITAALDGMLNFCLILNLQRQAVFVNKPLREFLAANGIKDAVGRRFGDLAGCSHPAESEGGCGTTEACARCGAAQAVAEALNGREAAKECRILSKRVGDDLDLQVSLKPLTLGKDKFLLMSLIDISSDKRRAVMERLFFHDVINTAGGVQGLLSVMETADPGELKGYLSTAVSASDRLVDQILSQKDLAAAERGELSLRAAEVGTAELLREVAGLFAAHEVAKDKRVELAADCADAVLTTDRTLLSRVIGNMTKNALEAEPAGSVVTLGARETASGILFTVHNPGQMPEDSRLQVFQRSFSTKGAGRGLGTYSIRLLTEKYLKGKVSFSTGPGGTTFTAEYPKAL